MTIKAALLAFEVASGNKNDVHNALKWNKATMNLPGLCGYNTAPPWVHRIHEDGQMAGVTPGYVGDLIPVDYSEIHCWEVSHQAVARISYLGLQNASLKPRPPSMEP